MQNKLECLKTNILMVHVQALVTNYNSQHILTTIIKELLIVINYYDYINVNVVDLILK